MKVDSRYYYAGSITSMVEVERPGVGGSRGTRGAMGASKSLILLDKIAFQRAVSPGTSFRKSSIPGDVLLALISMVSD